MRIRKWHFYIVFNCAFIIPCLFGKPVSLNAIIAAEKDKTQVPTPKSKLKGLVRKSVSLNALIAAENQKKHVSTPEQKIKDTPRIKQISSLKDRRTDINSIKTLFKPHELINKLRKKRKNKSNKREIVHHEDFDGHYMPLLGNLNKLFDKVFHNGAGTANKFRKFKHNNILTERNRMVCTCQQKSGHERSSSLIKSPKKTIAHAKTVSPEVSSDSEAAAETAPDLAVAYIRRIGSNKNLSPLLPRNSISRWRNNNGHSERSSTAFHGDPKRNITRNYGNGQYNSRIRENETNTSSYEEDTHSFARNSTSSDGFGRGDRNDTRNSDGGKKTEETIKIEENKNGNGGSSTEFNGKITFKVGSNETGGEISLPEYVGGLRGQVPEGQIGAYTHKEPIQSKDHEKSNDYVALDRASDQRISDRSGPTSTETEGASTENITVISIKDLSNLTLALQSAPKGNLPVVTIFGGYSVAKDINGQNKLSEQSIHIYS